MSVTGKKKKIFDGRYELVSIVGRGKKSVVYHALFDGKVGQDVALKVLLPNKNLPSIRTRLRNEAQAMLSATHPFVVKLNDFQSYEDLSYFSLEYAPYGDLRKYVTGRGTLLPPAQAERFFRQIVEALHFCHSVGVIHRDVKPDNILVINDDETRLGDFGVAVVSENPELAQDLGKAIGTMAYLSPEILEGQTASPVSDLYSLGLSFYEMLTGDHPFDHVSLVDTLEIRKKLPPHLSKQVAGISPAFSEVLMRLLQPLPENRFQTAKEVLNFLSSSQSKETPEANATTIEEEELQASSQRSPNLERYPLQERQVAEPISHQRDPISISEQEQEPEEDSSDTFEDNPHQVEEPKAETRHRVIMKSSDELSESSPSNPSTEEFSPNVVSQVRSQVFHGMGAHSPVADTETSTSTSVVIDDEDEEQEGGKSRRSHLARRALIAFLGAVIVTSEFLGLTQVTVISRFTPEQFKQTPHSLNLEQTPQTLSFPAIPKGVFSGYVQGLIPGKTLPLSIVSDSTQSTIIIGASGWIPKIATVVEENTLEVSSNGWILRFTGAVDSNTLTGEVTNLVTGDRGVWKASST